jgi:hypothetical protein
VRGLPLFSSQTSPMAAPQVVQGNRILQRLTARRCSILHILNLIGEAGDLDHVSDGPLGSCEPWHREM